MNSFSLGYTQNNQNTQTKSTALGSSRIPSVRSKHRRCSSLMHPSMAILRLRRRSNTKPVSSPAGRNISTDAGRLDCSLNTDARPLLLSPTIRSPLVQRNPYSDDTPCSGGGKKKSYLEKPRKDLPETKERRDSVKKSVESVLESPSTLVTTLAILPERRSRNSKHLNCLAILDADSLQNDRRRNSFGDSDDNADDLATTCGHSDGAGCVDSQTAATSRDRCSRRSQSSVTTNSTSVSNSGSNKSPIHGFRKSDEKPRLNSPKCLSTTRRELCPPPNRNNAISNHELQQSPRTYQSPSISNSPSVGVDQSFLKPPVRIFRSKSEEWSKLGGRDSTQTTHRLDTPTSTRKLPQRSKSTGIPFLRNHHSLSPSLLHRKSDIECTFREDHIKRSATTISKVKNKGKEDETTQWPRPSASSTMNHDSASRSLDGCQLVPCSFSHAESQTPQIRSKPSLHLDLSPWLRTESSPERSISSRCSSVTRKHRFGEAGGKSGHLRSSVSISSTRGAPCTPKRTTSLSKKHKSPHEYICSTLEEQRALAKELAAALSSLPGTPLSASQRRKTSWVAAERSKVASSPHSSVHRRSSFESHDSRTAGIHPPPGSQSTIASVKSATSTEPCVSSSRHGQSSSTRAEAPFITRRSRNPHPSSRARTTQAQSPVVSCLRRNFSEPSPPPSPPTRPFMRKAYSQSSLKTCRSQNRAMASHRDRPDLRATYSQRSLLGRRRSLAPFKPEPPLVPSSPLPPGDSSDVPVGVIEPSATSEDRRDKSDSVPDPEVRGGTIDPFESNPNLEAWDSSSSTSSASSASSPTRNFVSRFSSSSPVSP